MVAPLDLNLVRVFLTVFDAGSVSRAAERMNVTQPSISYALSKLRKLMGDPLFIRSRDGMRPTPLAERIHVELAIALNRIDDVLADSLAFVPLTSSRTFVVAMSDIGEMVFLPPILQALRREAPKVKLKIVQPPLEQLRRGLATGSVTAAVGHYPSLAAEMRTTPLFDEHYVCCMRAGHHYLDGPLTLARFAAARHVEVASEATGHHMVQRALDANGIDRHIALSIAHFATLSRVIAGSDLLAIVPSRLADLFARDETVAACDLPFAVPSFPVQIYVQPNGEAARASQWLRSLIAGALANMT